MAASGSRTEPRAVSRQPSASEGPRFQDLMLEEARLHDVNPYLAGHRSWGAPILPASEAWKYKGRWAGLFGREAPLHVEIGSGNGFFLSGMAALRPDWNWLGIELRYKRVVLCAKKIRTAGVTNAWISRYHAAYLDDLFETGEVAGLYVNHPDPWPKERHEKNRLISRWFLEEVARLLCPGGWLRIKSDFAPNCERVPALLDRGPDGEPLPPLPLRVTVRSSDVNGLGAPWGLDVATNYQRKMRDRGIPVHAIEALRTQ